MTLEDTSVSRKFVIPSSNTQSSRLENNYNTHSPTLNTSDQEYARRKISYEAALGEWQDQLHEVEQGVLKFQRETHSPDCGFEIGTEIDRSYLVLTLERKVVNPNEHISANPGDQSKQLSQRIRISRWKEKHGRDCFRVDATTGIGWKHAAAIKCGEQPLGEEIFKAMYDSDPEWIEDNILESGFTSPPRAIKFDTALGKFVYS